jgi:transposase
MEHAQKKKTSKPYSPEFRERAVRLLLEHRDEHQSEAAALTEITSKLGCSPDSLRVWMRQAQRDGGERPGQTTADRDRIKQLERDNRELRKANEILKKATVCTTGQRNIFDLRCSERTHNVEVVALDCRTHKRLNSGCVGRLGNR